MNLRLVKKQNKRYIAQRSGFRKTDIPFDKGYTKSFKDGRRAHKYSKSGDYHIDKRDPAKDPVGHLIHDVAISRVKNRFRK